MSLRRLDGVTGGNSFPRVSGDEPVAYREEAVRRVFSPRERG